MSRIGVYTICRNESKFVEQWVRSMWCNGEGADRAYILDTGSTDDTVGEFLNVTRALGIPDDWLTIKTTTYDMFRFDIARNDNLAMVNDDTLDALVSVDLDETLIPEFWRDVRQVIDEHPDFKRVYYLYAWNHDEKGRPKRVFWYDKVHPVKNVYWKHPVHESLVDDPDRQGTYNLDENKIYLHHWADRTKSRSQYLPLLEIRLQEEPDDVYGQYYLMREYMFSDPSSIKALRIAQECYIKLISGNVEEEYDCLPFFILAIADIYNGWGLTEDAEFYYIKAMSHAPYIRQTYMSYASFAAYHGKYDLAYKLLDEADKHAPTKYSTWYECDYNWTWRPMQIRAVAKCWEGKYEEARDLFKEALRKYIRTDIDRGEARINLFYGDYDWVKKKLRRRRKE